MSAKIEIEKFIGQRYDDNPCRLSDSQNVLNDAVRLVNRHKDLKQFFTNTNFDADLLHRHYAKKGRDFGYIEGANVALRLLKQDSFRFLKLKGYIKAAQDYLHSDGTNPLVYQSGMNLNLQIAPERAAKIEENIPYNIPVLIVVIVALGFAFRDMCPHLSPLWPYEFMRIRPAIFNILGFNENKLAVIKNSIPNFEQKYLEASGQKSTEVLKQLADGYPACYFTIKSLEDLVETNLDYFDQDFVLGEIISYPGDSRAKKSKNPCEVEAVVTHLLDETTH